MMITTLRARAALLVCTAVLLAACGSTTTGSAASSAPPSSTAPSATFTPTPEPTTPAPLPDAQRWLPAKHLAPASGWTSNPGGLVYENGTYHAFYRHNPAGEDVAGAVDWAHATSTDLVNWTEQPVAIPGTDDEQVLTGSVVADTDNTSGLGSDSEPPLVAIYTNVIDDSQSLAYSTDHGQTWQQDSGNPVLESGISGESLRDPKVFWYEPGGYWVMVAAVTDEFAVQLYRSKNLTNWTYLSEVTGVGSQAGPWESPDLFPLALDGDPANVKWVMPVSIRADQATDTPAAATESATTDSAGTDPPAPKTAGPSVQYFVGSFDGETFTPEPLGPAGVGAPQPGEMFSWMDWGADFTSATTVNGAPDGRTVALGWLNNWMYSGAVPTSPSRGSMTLPRELTLGTVDGVPRLLESIPTEAATAMTKTPPVYAKDSVPITNGSRKLDSTASGTNLLIQATLVPGAAQVSGVTVLGSGTGKTGTRIQYVTETGILQVDRTTSGQTGFSPAFSLGSAAPVALTDGKLNLRIVVDGDSVEVFAGDGKAVISSLVFPAAGDDDVALFAGGGKAIAENVSVTQIGG